MPLIPVRCFSCNKTVANNWDKYTSKIFSLLSEIELEYNKENTSLTYNEYIQKKNLVSKKVLDDLGYERMCCRRMFISQPDIIDTIMQY